MNQIEVEEYLEETLKTFNQEDNVYTMVTSDDIYIQWKSDDMSHEHSWPMALGRAKFKLKEYRDNRSEAETPVT